MTHFFSNTIRTFFFLFSISTLSANSNLEIRDIRVGTELNKTRVEIEMSYPVSLYIEDRGAGAFLISGPEDTFWNVPSKKMIDKGPLKSYEVIEMDWGKGCLLQFNPYTQLKGSFGRGDNYILDLETNIPPPPPPVPEPEEIEEKPLDLPDPKPLLPKVTLNQTVNVVMNQINSLSVLPKEDGTTWIIINSDKAEFFEFQHLKSDYELQIYLPKINWPKMNTEVIDSGLVTSYAVDEASEKMSAVSMRLPKDKMAEVVDLFSAPNLDRTNDFVIVLASRVATSDENRRIAEKRMYLKKNLHVSAGSFDFRPPQARYSEEIEDEGPYLPEGYSAKDAALPPQEDSLFDSL